MKISILMIACIVILVGISSCKKNDNNTAGATICTIIINDTLTVKPDSVVWDYYTGTIPHMQAFTNGEATFTLWPATFNSGTATLERQRIYWIYKTAVYTPGTISGSLVLSNNNNMLSGSFAATGVRWSGTGPDDGKVSATFTNVRERK